MLKPDMKNPMPGINWNRIEDEIDLTVWNRLTSAFWLPEAIPVSNDLQSWAKLSEEEKTTTKKVFSGLTGLDYHQSAGAAEIMKYPETPHEEAVMSNLVFMEHVHARSYSSIFSTLCSTAEIDEAFQWLEEDYHFQKKIQTIQKYYDQGNALKMRIASVMLESFLFYSGFYWPMHMSAHGKLTNTADIIRLIIADEAIHGYYIGYKFQKASEHLSQSTRQGLKDFTMELAQDLYENEVIYTRNLYDDVGLTEDALHFVRYNMNKALMNLGYEAWFDSDKTQVSAAILSSLSPDSNETHDFFSGAGSSYMMGTVEDLADDEWAF